MNTAGFLLEQSADSQVAVVTAQGNYTYGDLKSAVAAMQSSFRSLGAQPGDRIGIWAQNSLFWIASYLSAMSIGAVAVPFATTLTASDFLVDFSLVSPSILCIDQRILKKHASILPSGVEVLQNEGERSLLSQGGSFQVDPQFDDHRDAALMFTSGTTAYPRVVRITHRNIQANTTSIVDSISLTAEERIMVILPFYYCFGTSLLHTHLRAGGTLVLTGGLVFPETVLDQIDEKGCTGIAGVPTIYQTLLRNTSFTRRSLPTLKKIQQAGGKLSEVLIRELRDNRPDSEIYIMYGQTEATARLSCLDPSQLDEKLGSIGKGIPGVDLHVLNEKGDPVQPGETGEIVARGDNISPGYLNDPEADREKFVDGALRTGDLATVDDDGYIYIVDRKSDFIKSYGNRVSPQQVEAVALELPDVVSASAVGLPDEARGEAIILFVTLKSGSIMRPEDIIRYFKTHAAPHIVPREARVISSMPVNANGKIVKSELKKLVTF